MYLPCVKTNPAPLQDENFFYKKVWGAVEPNRRPKPKIVAKKDTTSWKIRQTILKVGCKGGELKA